MKDIFYFEELNMASHYDKGKIHNVVLNTDVKPGYFVKVTGVAPGKFYGEHRVNYSTLTAESATSDDGGILVLDPSSVNEVQVNGNVFRIGETLYNHTIPAGTPVRARELRTLDRFYLGRFNFDGTEPQVGDYAVLTDNGNFKLKVASPSDLDTAQFVVQIVEVTTKTAGATAAFKVYGCLVVRASAI